MFACFGRSSKKGKDALKSDTTDVPRKSEKGQGVACPPWPSGQLVHLQHWEDAACSGLQAAVVRVAVGGPLVACAKAPGESTLTPARYARLLSEFADTDDLFRAALESFHNLQKKGASAHLRAMTLEMATPPSWKAAIRFSNGGTSDRIRMHYTSVRTSGSAVAPALHIEHLPASQTVASMQPVVPDSDLVPRVPNFNFSASERGTVLSGKELMTPTRWRRAQIMQAEVPVLLTLFSQDGCVLEQNYNSIMYFGSIAGQYMWKETLGSRGSDHGRPGTLEQLFEHAPEAFEEVIEHLMYPENGPWKGTVQVKVQGLDRVSRANSAHPASARCSLPSVRTTPLNMARSSTGTGKEGLHLQLPSEDACAATEQGRGFAAEDTARNESWDTASSRPGSHGAVSVASGSYKTLAPPCSSAQAPCVPPSRSLNPRLSKSCSYMRQAETVALQHPDSQVSSHTSCTLPMAPMSLGNMGRNCSQDSREAETIRPASTGALGPPPMPLEQRLHRNSSMGPASGTRSNQNSRLASQLAAKMMHHSFHERVHLSYQAPAEQPLVPRRPSEALSSTASHLPSTTSGLRHSPLGTAETETPDYFSMSHVHQSVARLERQATGVSSLAGGSYNSSQHGRQHCSSRHLSISQEQPCVVRSESQATVTPWTLGGVSNSSSQGDRRHSDARPPAAADLLGWSAQTSQGQHAKGAVNKCVPEQLLQQQQQQQQQQASCHLLELPKRRHSESFPMRPHSELQLQQQQQQQHRLSQQVRVISGPGSVDRHPRVRFSGPGTTLEPEDGGESKQRISRPRSTSCLGGPPAGSPIFQEVAGQGGMGPATGGPFFQEVVGLHEMKSEQLVQQHAHVPGSQSTPISLEVADQHEIKSEQAAQQHAHVPGSPGSPIFQRVGSLHEISSAQLAQHTHVHGGSQGAPTSLQTPQRQSPCNESAKGQAMQPEQQQQQQQHEQEGERAQSRDLEGSMEEGHSTISGKQEQSLNGSSFSRARSRRRSHSNLLNQLDIDPPAQEKSVMYQEVEIKLVTDPETDRPAFLLLQRDVSEQVELENLLSELTEDQLAMLSQIFPRHVIHALSTDGAVTLDNIADLTCSHADVTILFLDIVSFTSTCGKGSVSPESVITFLNILFSRFDKLVQKYQVQKIDTIGDAYLVASGILAPDEDGFWAVDEFHDAALGAGRMMSLAVDMMRAALEVRMPDDQPVKLRIGLHTGPCVSGLVGLDVPKWSVFGDTVNTAARLEQTALPTTIQISNATKSLLPSLDLKLVHNGAVAMKGKGTMETWLWHSPPEWVRAWEGDEVPPLPSGIVELHRLCSPDPGSELGPTEGEDEEEYFQDFQEDVPRAQKETQDSFNFSNAGILLPSQGAPNSPKPIVIAPANGIADASIIHGEMEAVVVEEGVMLGTVSHEECQIGKNSSDVLTTSHAEHKAECLINRSQPLTHIGGLLVHGHTSAPMSSISVPTSNNGDSDIVRGILQQQDVVSEQRRCSKEEQRRPGFAVVGNLRNRDEMQEGGGKDEGAEHAEELSGDRLVTLPYWVRDSQPTLSPISSVSSGMVDRSSRNKLYFLPEDLQCSTQDLNRSKDMPSFSPNHNLLSSGNAAGQTQAAGGSSAQVISLRNSPNSLPSCQSGSNPAFLGQDHLPSVAPHAAPDTRQSWPHTVADDLGGATGLLGPTPTVTIHTRSSDPSHTLTAAHLNAGVPQEWKNLWETRLQGKHELLAWSPPVRHSPPATTRALMNTKDPHDRPSSNSDADPMVTASMPCAQFMKSDRSTIRSHSIQRSSGGAAKLLVAHAQDQEGLADHKDAKSMPLMFRIKAAPTPEQQGEGEEDRSSVGNAAGKSRTANLASKLVLSNKAGFGSLRLNGRVGPLQSALQGQGLSSFRRQHAPANHSTSPTCSNATFHQSPSHSSLSTANNIYKGLAKAHAHIGVASGAPPEQQQQQQKSRPGSGRQRRGNLVLSARQLSMLQSLQE